MIKKATTLLILAALIFLMSGCGTFLFERQDDADAFEARWHQTKSAPSKSMYYTDDWSYKGPPPQTRLFGFTKGEDVHWLFGKFGQNWLWRVDDKGEIQCCF